MAKCKTDGCIKDALVGEKYCAACKSNRDSKCKKVTVGIVTFLVAILSIFAIGKKGGSSIA